MNQKHSINGRNKNHQNGLYGTFWKPPVTVMWQIRIYWGEGGGGVRGGGGVSLFTCTAEQQDFALRRILWPTDCDRHHESHLTLVLSAENRFHLSLPHENITGFIGYCYPHSKSPTLSAFVQIAEGCKLYSDQQNCRVTTKYYVCLSQWWIKIKVLAEPPVKSY